MAVKAKTSRRKTRRFDEPLIAMYIFAVVVGLVMVYSSSSMIAESRFGSNLYFLKNQFVAALISAALVFGITRIDLKKYAVYSVPALFLTLICLALVFIMPARNGSQRWLLFGSFGFQPSEVFKFVTVVFLAFSLSNRNRDITRLKQLLVPYVPLIGGGLVLIILEPDLGTTIVLSLTVIGILFLAGARIKHLAAGFLPITAAGSFLVFVLGYKKARVMSFIDSVLDPLQGGYQVKQAALTLGSGGIFGAGLGDGRQKAFFLPYPYTDFIFASIGEELGLIGLMGILTLLFAILWRGLKIASKQPDRFGFLLASGMTLSLFVNIAINIAVVTSLMPCTGLALPFISYGGTSLLVSSATIGVLLNLSTRGSRAR